MLIFLIGYMGCGKSTIGRKLSKELSLPLYDTDKVIVEREGRAVVDIFAQDGEAAFRAMERELLVELIERDEAAIIATGGGLPMQGDNMELINGAGVSIFLSRGVDNIISRMSKKGREKRPKIRGLNDKELKAYMESELSTRLPFYSRATVTLSVDALSDEKIVKRVIAAAVAAR